MKKFTVYWQNNTSWSMSAIQIDIASQRRMLYLGDILFTWLTCNLHILLSILLLLQVIFLGNYLSVIHKYWHEHSTQIKLARHSRSVECILYLSLEQEAALLLKVLYPIGCLFCLIEIVFLHCLVHCRRTRMEEITEGSMLQLKSLKVEIFTCQFPAIFSSVVYVLEL